MEFECKDVSVILERLEEKPNVIRMEGSGDKIKCSCECERRLEALEKEVANLKKWKTCREGIDDIISDWKTEIEKWLLSNFGFRINVNSKDSQVSTSSTTTSNGLSSSKTRPAKKSTNTSNSEVVEVETNGGNVAEFVDEGASNAESDVEAVLERSVEDVDTHFMDDAETENVEITPDIFGHFLLDTNFDGLQSDNDNDCVGESVDEEEEEEVEPLRKSGRAAKRKGRNDDSDSDVYTVTSSTEESEESSSEDEYTPVQKRGRGRAVQVRNSNHLNSGRIGITSKISGPPRPTTNMVDRKELLKNLTKRQGNIWECNVCGFMLSSLDNMLLHIKYNHSTSTHTCPYCRVVVLCRSPKDAVMHQEQCQKRFSNTGAVSKPIHVPVPRMSVKEKKIPVPEKDVHSKVDKFVSDLLEPTSSKRSVMKKTEPPAVVTLSSDDEDEDDED